MSLDTEFSALKASVDTWTKQHDNSSAERAKSFKAEMADIKGFLISLNSKLDTRPCEKHAEKFSDNERQHIEIKDELKWARRLAFGTLIMVLVALFGYAIQR